MSHVRSLFLIQREFLQVYSYFRCILCISVVKTSEFLSCMLREVFIAEGKDSTPGLADILQKILHTVTC